MMNDLVRKMLSGESVRKVIDEATNRKFKAHYIVSSERANRRSDEDHVDLYSNKILDVGDSFEMDGLTWTVDEVVSDEDRDIHEAFESRKFSGKGSGKRLEFEDDLVIVYDAKTGEELYKGLEDYEDYKDEDWVFDKSIGAYRFGNFIKEVV